jgi:hypothetical protein
MNRIFPLPAYTFLKTIYKYGGISFKGIRNLPPWFIKTILFEPLRWIELGYNNKINRHVLKKDPVFILGYYRSGTSFLHEFITQDNRFGYHTNFQMILPDMVLSSEWFLSPFFDAICRLFNFQDPVHRIQMSFRFPGEEDGAMTTSLNPRGAAWGHFFPEIMMEQFQKYVLFENIPDSEREAWTNDYLFLLKKISLASGGKQLLLKSPPNTARVKLLLSVFPNARFVFLHRNPYEVYTSNQQFWKVVNRIYVLGKYKSVDINAIILDTYAGMMDRYLQDKHLIPEGQLIEIPYSELIQNPMENMQNIYNTLHLDDINYCEKSMKAYIEKHKNYPRLKHELLGEERNIVTSKLEPYLRHWQYPLL